MTTGTVVLLAVVWAAVLLPGAVRDRRRSPLATVDGFHAAMERLAHCDQRSVVVPGRAGSIVYPRPDLQRALRERRRHVLTRLLVLEGVTALLAVLFGGVVVGALAVSTVALVGYVVALRWLAVRRARAREVVRLHPASVAGRRAIASRHVPRQGRVVQSRAAGAPPVPARHGAAAAAPVDVRLDERVGEPLFAAVGE